MKKKWEEKNFLQDFFLPLNTKFFYKFLHKILKHCFCYLLKFQSVWTISTIFVNTKFPAVKRKQEKTHGCSLKGCRTPKLGSFGMILVKADFKYIRVFFFFVFLFFFRGGSGQIVGYKIPYRCEYLLTLLRADEVNFLFFESVNTQWIEWGKYK